MENRIFDIHSHILPGLDDGAKDMNMAIEMLKTAENEGITNLFLTPHYQKPLFTPSANLIIEAYEQLLQEAKKHDIKVRLYLGCEVLYYTDLIKDLKERTVLTMNASRYVLIEFYPNITYSEMKIAIRRLVNAGFIPIIAHVERYICLLRSSHKVKELINQGAMIQANTSSFMGEEGLAIQFFVRKLLKMEQIHFIGTDAHSLGKRKPLMKKCVRVFNDKYSDEYVRKVLHRNAECMISSAFLM